MTENYTESPTVALVHGAFADAGSFAAVTELLLAAGVKVQALVNPLRGLAVDSAYVASALSQITGPVLAVGHSYGGAVITNAATSTPNVVRLVDLGAGVVILLACPACPLLFPDMAFAGRGGRGQAVTCRVPLVNTLSHSMFQSTARDQ